MSEQEEARETLDRRLDDPDDPLFRAYDREGNRISIRRLWELEREAEAEGRHYRKVAVDEVGDLQVSTVLLMAPIIAFADEDGPPAIFETAVVTNGEDYDVVARYRTLEAAQRGHREIVADLERTVHE